jgi:hypothetical protein
LTSTSTVDTKNTSLDLSPSGVDTQSNANQNADNTTESTYSNSSLLSDDLQNWLNKYGISTQSNNDNTLKLVGQ